MSGENRAVVRRKGDTNLELICVWGDKCIRLDRDKEEPIERVFEKLSAKVSKVDAPPKRKKVDLPSAESIAKSEARDGNTYEANDKSNAIEIAFLDANRQRLYSSEDKSIKLENAIDRSAYLQVDDLLLKIIKYPVCPDSIDIPQRCYANLPVYISISPPSMIGDLLVEWFVCRVEALPKVVKKKPVKKSGIQSWQSPSPNDISDLFREYRSFVMQRSDAFDVTLSDPRAFAEYRGKGLVHTFQEADIGSVCLARVSKAGCPGYYGVAIGATTLLPPIGRPIWNAERMGRLKPRNEKHLRVCSWNILAPVYAKSDRATDVMFPYCPPDKLDFVHRRSLIARELQDIDADILCLQECGSEVKDDLLAAYCAANGYKYSFFSKITKANEGLFIGWRNDRFRLIEERCVPFKESQVWKNKALVDQLTTLWPGFYDNVCMRMSAIFHFIALHDTKSGRDLLLANNHFYWHPNASHIRTLQAYAMLFELGRFYHHLCVAQQDLPVDVIVCGDFNADDNTGAIDLIVNGAVTADHPSWKDAQVFATRHIPDADDNAEVSDIGMRSSTYSDDGPTLLSTLTNLLRRSQPFGELEFTTTIGQFFAVLDWIFISPSLKVVDSLRGVPLKSICHDEEDTIGADKGVLPGLPSARFPSDHIPLVIDLCT